MAANHTVATSVSLVMFIPIYLVVVNSLKTDAQARSMGAGLPSELRWDNYDVVIEEGKLATGVRQQHDLHGVRDRRCASCSRPQLRSCWRGTAPGSIVCSTCSW